MADVEYLMNAIARGEPEAYRGLVHALSEPLFRYAIGIVRDEAAAQDVVQQTFIRLFRSRTRLEAGGTLRGYCYRIAGNLAKNTLRDERLRRDRESQAMPTQSSSGEPAQAVLAREAWRLVQGLPQDQREALVLRFEHGLTLGETAHALGLPEGTVSTRQRGGLQRLREKLGANLSVPAGLELADLLGQGPTFTTVAVPSSLVTSVETAVMATIGTKTLSGTAITIIILLLLTGAGVGAWVAFGSPHRTQSVAHHNTRACAPLITGQPSRRDNACSPRAPGPLAGPSDRGKDNPPDKSKTQPSETNPHNSIPPKAPANAVAARPFKATVRGKVTDNGLRPLAGVVVLPVGPSFYFVTRIGGQDPETRKLAEASGTAATDEQGRFELELGGMAGAAEGPIYFALLARPTVTTDGRAQYVAAQSLDLWVVNGGTLEGVLIPLSRPVSICGKVVQKGTNSPVGGVPVAAVSYWQGANPSRTSLYSAPEDCLTRSAEDGSFCFSRLPAGNYTVSICGARDGKVRDDGDSNGSLLASADVAVAEGRSIDVVLEYDGAYLLFRTEPAVERLNVKFELAVGRSYHYLKAEKDGTFRVQGVHSGLKSMFIESDLYGHALVKLSAEDGKDLELGTIKLVTENHVRGVVVDAKDKPSARARVKLTQLDGNNSHYQTTDANGVFQVANLEPGTWAVDVTHPASGAASTRLTVAKDTLTEVKLKLDEVVSGIRGTVSIGGRAPTPTELGATGEPVFLEVRLFDGGFTPAAVAAKPYSDTHQRSYVDDQGRFDIPFVKPGQWTVACFLGSRVGVKTGVEVKEGEFARTHINIDEGGAVFGRIIDREGKPAARVHVSISRFSLSTFSFSNEAGATTDDDGCYTIEGLSAGSYYLRLDGDGELMSQKQLAARAFTVKAGGRTEKNLDLSQGAGASIAGRATIGGAAGFKEVVLISPGDMSSLRSSAMDSTGNFELTDVEPGSYYLWFTDNKYNPKRFAREVVEVKSGVLRVEREFTSASVTGQVRVIVEPEEFRFSKVKVEARPVLNDSIGPDPIAMMAVYTVYCDPEGKFEFPQLAGGSYTLTAVAPEMPPQVQRHNLDGPKVLEFVLGGKAGTLEIKVKAILGEDTAGAIVETSELSRMMMLSLSDAKGKPVSFDGRNLPSFRKGEIHRVPSLPEGEYRLELVGMHMEKWTATATIKEGETTQVEATLQRAAVIRLRVGNAELTAAQVQGAKVKVFDAEGRQVMLGADLTSAFGIEPEAAATKVLKLTPLTAGTYRVVVTLEDYQPLEVQVTVARSSIAEQDITLLR